MAIDSLSALYFPATRIAAATATRLLLPLSKLYSYRPAEGPPAMPQPLAATGLVETYPPVPLGEDLGRFLQLLKDMQTHSAEYHQAHLSSLAAGAEEDPEAGWRQVARQLKQSVPNRETKEAGLWQARLYLALAENHVALQDELTAGIQAVSRREAELLRQLQGEDEELAELPLLQAASTAMNAVWGEQSLFAWGLLYLADTNPDRPWLLTTAQEDNAGLLFDKYERTTGCSPEKLLALPLPPSVWEAGEEFSENRQTIRMAAQGLLARLGDFIAEAAFAESGPKAADFGQPIATELTLGWQQILDRYAKAPQKQAAKDGTLWPAPATALTFYRLPGMSFPRLFGLLCRQKEKTAGPVPPNAILAVLTSGPTNTGCQLN